MAARVSAVFFSFAAAVLRTPTGSRCGGEWLSPQSSRRPAAGSIILSYRRDGTGNDIHHRHRHRHHHHHRSYTTMASDPAVDKILAGKYPAKKHAERVARYIRDAHPEITDGLIYLESQKQKLLEDSDSEGESFLFVSPSSPACMRLPFRSFHSHPGLLYLDC